MRLTIKGGSPVIDHGEWSHAAYWMSDFLLGIMAQRIHLKLVLSDYIPQHSGYIVCNCWDTKRKFTMEIETGRSSRRTQFYSLAHELVHMRQIVMGQLTRKDGSFLWRSSRYRNVTEEPWEMEAYEMEKPLVRLYSESLRYHK